MGKKSKKLVVHGLAKANENKQAEIDFARRELNETRAELEKKETALQQLEKGFKSQDKANNNKEVKIKSLERMMSEKDELILSLIPKAKIAIEYDIRKSMMELDKLDEIANSFNKIELVVENVETDVATPAIEVKEEEVKEEPKKEVEPKTVVSVKHRGKLRERENKKMKYVMTYVRRGAKKNELGQPQETMLFENVRCAESNEALTSHVWMNATKRLDKLCLNEKDIIELEAIVKPYKKIERADNGKDMQVTQDWGLRYPSQVKKIGKKVK